MVNGEKRKYVKKERVGAGWSVSWKCQSGALLLLASWMVRIFIRINTKRNSTSTLLLGRDHVIDGLSLLQLLLHLNHELHTINHQLYLLYFR